MTSKIQEALESLLADGRCRVGEVVIAKVGEGFVLTHHADAANEERQAEMRRHSDPRDAREISKYDASGEFRPLKTAPDLQRGWLLYLRSIAELQEALDFFYPAMLGVWLAHGEGGLKPVHFRETAGRQSGMYEVVKKISDAQADELIGDFCKSDGKCLKTILWKIDCDMPITKLPADKFDPGADQLKAGGKSMPLLCTEACNLLVAAARSVMRKSRGKE